MRNPKKMKRSRRKYQIAMSEKGKRIIEVVDYDPYWPEQFQVEAKNIKQQIKPLSIKLYHIGSTSVPGLAAKPTIDILAEVSDMNSFVQVAHKLAAADYVAKGENGISGRRYFEKGGVRHICHLHVFERGNSHIYRHLCFRDYLIAHPDIASEYGLLKKRNAKSCNNNIDAYCQDKNDFVKNIESLAIKWGMKVNV